MRYREIEFSVVQGIGRQLWKWSVSLDANHSVTGQAATKPEAVAEAERAMIGRWLSKNCGLSRPDTAIDRGGSGGNIGYISRAGGCTSHGRGPRSDPGPCFLAGTIPGFVLKFPVLRGGEMP